MKSAPWAKPQDARQGSDEHDNDANVVAFSATTEKETVFEIVRTFMSTPFSNEERHQRRIDKIKAYEENN